MTRVEIVDLQPKQRKVIKKVANKGDLVLLTYSNRRSKGPLLGVFNGAEEIPRGKRFNRASLNLIYLESPTLRLCEPIIFGGRIHPNIEVHRNEGITEYNLKDFSNIHVEEEDICRGLREVFEEPEFKILYHDWIQSLKRPYLRE